MLKRLLRTLIHVVLGFLPAILYKIIEEYNL